MPAFLSQAYPTISRADPDIRWSSIKGILFLRNEQGMWRCDVRAPFQPQWTMLRDDDAIVDFAVSSDGTSLLLQTAPAGEGALRDITLLDAESGALVDIGRGWNAVFSADGESLFYSDLKGFYECALDGKRVRTWAPVSHP